MNEENLEARIENDEEQPSPLPSPETGEGGKTVYSGLERLPYHPNRHDRRKAAAIARKEAKREGKK